MQPPFFRTHPAPISHANLAYEETVLKTVNVTYVGSLQANEGGNDRYSKAEHSVFCVVKMIFKGVGVKQMKTPENH